MEEIIAGLGRAGPKVAAIVIVGWVSTEFIVTGNISLGSMIVLFAVLITIMLIYFFSPQNPNKPKDNS